MQEIRGNNTEPLKPYKWEIAFIHDDSVEFVIYTTDEDYINWTISTSNIIYKVTDTPHRSNKANRTRLYMGMDSLPTEKISEEIGYRVGSTNRIECCPAKLIKEDVEYCYRAYLDYYNLMVQKLIKIGYEEERAKTTAKKFVTLYHFNPTEQYQMFCENLPDENGARCKSFVLKERMRMTYESIIAWYINDLCDWFIKDKLDIIDLEYREAWEVAEEDYIIHKFREYRKNKAEKEKLCLAAVPDIHITEDELAYLNKCIDAYRSMQIQEDDITDAPEESLDKQDPFTININVLSQMLCDNLYKKTSDWSFIKLDTFYEDIYDSIENIDGLYEVVRKTVSLLGEKGYLAKSEINEFSSNFKPSPEEFKILIWSKCRDYGYQVDAKGLSVDEIAAKLTFLYFFDCASFYEFILKEYISKQGIVLNKFPDHQYNKDSNLKNIFLCYQEAFIMYLLKTCLTSLKSDYENVWNKIEAERMAKFRNMKNLLK